MTRPSPVAGTHRAGPTRRRFGWLALFGQVIVVVAVVVGVVFAFRSTPQDASKPPPPSITTSSATVAPPTASRQAPLAPPALRKYCHTGDPLKGVYSPGRLTVKNPCVAVTGVVGDTNIEHDGDLHISLTQVERKWLNAGNLARTKQDLVVEVVPSMQRPAPAVNSLVTVIGPWVLDTETGWLEIHPVWAILPAG